jgi:hypothetical protein
LWFEFGEPPYIEHYVDVPSGLTACVGRLAIRGASTLTADATRRIAESVGPAPAHWPPDRD